MILFYMRGHEALDTRKEPNNIEFCNSSGERAYPGELVKDWAGNYVLPWHKDPEPYPEKVRSSPLMGAKRLEGENYISEMYPNGVSVDDL